MDRLLWALSVLFALLIGVQVGEHLPADTASAAGGGGIPAKDWQCIAFENFSGKVQMFNPSSSQTAEVQIKWLGFDATVHETDNDTIEPRFSRGQSTSDGTNRAQIRSDRPILVHGSRLSGSEFRENVSCFPGFS